LYWHSALTWLFQNILEERFNHGIGVNTMGIAVKVLTVMTKGVTVEAVVEVVVEETEMKVVVEKTEMKVVGEETEMKVVMEGKTMKVDQELTN